MLLILQGHRYFVWIMLSTAVLTAAWAVDSASSFLYMSKQTAITHTEMEKQRLQGENLAREAKPASCRTSHTYTRPPVLDYSVFTFLQRLRVPHSHSSAPFHDHIYIKEICFSRTEQPLSS